jgi:glutathione S-transferase
MLRIYYAPLSTAASRVRMCAEAIGLDYEPIAVDLRSGEQRSANYLEINPFGKVPAIDDDGFYLFESNAIMKYLCCKSRSDLYPDTCEGQAIVDQWCDFAASLLGPAYGRVIFNRIFAPAIGAPIDEASLADGLRFVERYLPVVDARLDTSDYIAGSSLTIADFAVLATIDPSEAVEIELSEYAALTTWRENLRAKPFYRAVHSYYGEGVLEPTAT